MLWLLTCLGASPTLAAEAAADTVTLPAQGVDAWKQPRTMTWRRVHVAGNVLYGAGIGSFAVYFWGWGGFLGSDPPGWGAFAVGGLAGLVGGGVLSGAGSAGTRNALRDSGLDVRGGLPELGVFLALIPGTQLFAPIPSVVSQQIYRVDAHSPRRRVGVALVPHRDGTLLWTVAGRF